MAKPFSPENIQATLFRIRETHNQHATRFGYECNLCGEAPTCPELLEEIWEAVKPQPKLIKHTHKGQTFTKSTALLCFHCAELRLNRSITVEDLKPHVRNYALVMMVRRAKESVR